MAQRAVKPWTDLPATNPLGSGISRFWTFEDLYRVLHVNRQQHSMRYQSTDWKQSEDEENWRAVLAASAARGLRLSGYHASASAPTAVMEIS
ncbi:hypothetical protein VFPBJ_11123 [Purpureocillium lilacinum]|uniref:Uncharacterized protein n=1 Tax=Purpureocillium lilacinum TaxID=33203 RepID=A0A179FKI0_PURLI|nr:hypothetical protein VFPBJ_11123 [Purpureocillium lilacinum]